jgi:hypothetical protein
VEVVTGTGSGGSWKKWMVPELELRSRRSERELKLKE